MKKIETNLKDCYIIEPDKFGDERGYFSQYYVKKQFKENNLDNIFGEVVQTNKSKSSKGVVRGLHFQKNPKCQAKIVECINGAVLDVVVDLRKDSETFKQWTSVLLTPENGRQLLVPRGFAHGFVSLKDDTIFQYLVDNEYAPELEDGIFYDDPEIGIDWKFKENDIENPIVSEKDKNRKVLSLRIEKDEINFSVKDER